MEGSDETGVLRRIHPSSGDYSFPSLNQPHHQINTHNQMAMNLTAEGGHKRPGIPPCHPHFPPASPQSQITMANKMTGQHQMGSQNFAVGPSHSRSLSQPSFFSFDHLPPLSPSPYVRESPSTTSIGDMSMEDKVYSNNAQQALHPAFAAAPSTHGNESLPPRRGHRRSSSDIPLGFASTVQPSSLQIPSGFPQEKYGGQRVVNLDKTKPIQLTTKREFGSSGFEESTEKKTEGETVDDLFSAYMNLDNIDTLNSSSVEDKDMDSSRASGTKTNDSSENEVESSIAGNCNANAISGGTRGEKKDRGKRSATGDIAPTSSRHFRSLSMDSFMGNLNFNEMSPKLPPSPGIRCGQHSPSDSFDGDSSKFSMEFGSGDFSAVEMKKIMANEKLAEIAMADPKRAKRILANRQSAARSKERKLRYIAELEHKVQTLQTEATTLSAQLTLLQRDSAGLTTQNNELKFRLQSMEQQAQLRDALNEALTAEVQRLKIATARIGESPQQLMLKDNFMQNQASQFNMYQMQQTQSHQSQNQNQNQQGPPTQQLMQNQSPESQSPQEEVGMLKS